MKNMLYWIPRVLSILLVLFISSFALDIFSEGLSGWNLALGLLMHLLPTLVTIVCLIVAWKRENVGGWLFIVLGIAFIFIGGFELIAVLLFTLPLLLIGSMFLLHHHTFSVKTKDSSQNTQ